MLDKNIETYVKENILPLYNSFDKAHSQEHVQKVIYNSLSIVQELDLNLDLNMVYVIAAYHDLGLIYGRKEHEKKSKAILLSDRVLEKWFSDENIVLMADAVEDHRASNEYEPRSIYGKIISDADSDIEYWVILKRIVQYSLEYFPEYSFDQHFERSFSYMRDKYGENGYLKLWLSTSYNRNNLKEIQVKLSQPLRMKQDFNLMFDECGK